MSTSSLPGYAPATLPSYPAATAQAPQQIGFASNYTENVNIEMRSWQNPEAHQTPVAPPATSLRSRLYNRWARTSRLGKLLLALFLVVTVFMALMIGGIRIAGQLPAKHAQTDPEETATVTAIETVHASSSSRATSTTTITTTLSSSTSSTPPVVTVTNHPTSTKILSEVQAPPLTVQSTLLLTVDASGSTLSPSATATSS